METCHPVLLPCKDTNILIFVTCGASFYLWVWSVQPPIPIPVGEMYLHARMFYALAHMLSIPMGSINFYMQELFYTQYYFYTHVCDVFTCKNVLYTHPYVFYSHGCNKFLHSRTFFTLTDTTFIPMSVMYLPARLFCTLAHTSCIPMGAVINF